MTYAYPYKRGTGWRSQGFRSNRNKGANGPGGHTGYDQAMDAGTPLYAPADGIVRNSSWVGENYLDNPWWLTQMGGDILVLDTFGPDGTTDTGPAFILAHLSDSIAEVGQRVKKGQLIALSGNSGTATTGPHVHIEALPPRWDFNNGVYGRVDPEAYFDEWPDDIAFSLAAQGSTTPLASEEDIMAGMTEDRLRAIVREEVAKTPQAWFTNKYGTPVQFESLLGQLDLNINQNNSNAQAKLDRIVGETVALRAAVTELAKGSSVTAEQVEKAMKEALAGFSITLSAEGAQ